MSKLKVAICNVGVGGAYAFGSRRLKESLEYHNIPWDKYIFINAYPEGCPSHQEQPYAFKLYAMKHAIQQGCDVMIWADSAVWAINGNVEPLIKAIEENGFYFPYSGYSIGQWTSDKCIKAMGFDRDRDNLHDASVSHMTMACFSGFSIQDQRVKDFIDEYMYWSLRNNGELLIGDWKNDSGQVSSDPRCTGHRHDQSVLSLLIKKYGVKQTISHENFFSYYPVPGHYVGKDWRDISVAKPHILDSICFLTQGVDGRDGSG